MTLHLIIVIVFKRLRNAPAHRLEASKVNDESNLVPLHNGLHQGRIKYAAAFEQHMQSTDALQAIKNQGAAVRKVVQDVWRK
jgi:hypothetical protein